MLSSRTEPSLPGDSTIPCDLVVGGMLIDSLPMPVVGDTDIEDASEEK